MAEIKWSPKLILRFLAEYEKEPVIWHPKYPKHKDRHSLHDAWKRIEINLGGRCSITELKRKKDALMATYRKVLSKMKNRNGPGTDNSYRPDWFAFDHMERFLRPIYRPNVPRATREIEPVKQETQEIIENEDDSDILDEVDEMEGIDEKMVFEVHALPNTSPQRQQIIHQPAHQATIPKQLTTSGFRRRRRPVQTMRGAKTRRRRLDSASDECSLYLELLASKLRALDENTRAFAMLQIDHFMFRLRQEKIDTLHAEHIDSATNSWFPQSFPDLNMPSTSGSYSEQPSSSKCQRSVDSADRSPEYSNSTPTISPLPPQSPIAASPSQQASPHSNHNVEDGLDFDPLITNYTVNKAM